MEQFIHSTIVINVISDQQQTTREANIWRQIIRGTEH